MMKNIDKVPMRLMMFSPLAANADRECLFLNVIHQTVVVPSPRLNFMESTHA
jgi:hypothetical protein